MQEANDLALETFHAVTVGRPPRRSKCLIFGSERLRMHG
jgi:hypothetical protein